MGAHPDSLSSIKVGLSLFPADVAAMKSRIRTLKGEGILVRNGTLLRALIYLRPLPDMISDVFQLFATYAQKQGPREDEPVTAHPTVDLPKVLVHKLDDVITAVRRTGLNTTRTFVVRAILRAAPADKQLAPMIRKFLVECPPRPSGWASYANRD